VGSVAGDRQFLVVHTLLSSLELLQQATSAEKTGKQNGKTWKSLERVNLHDRCPPKSTVIVLEISLD